MLRPHLPGISAWIGCRGVRGTCAGYNGELMAVQGIDVILERLAIREREVDVTGCKLHCDRSGRRFLDGLPFGIAGRDSLAALIAHRRSVMIRSPDTKLL